MVQEFTSIVIYLYLLFSINGVVLVYVYLRRNLNFSILTSLLLISCKKISVFSQPTSYRSSNRRCSVRKGVLRNFAKFTEKHLCQVLFFDKVAGLGMQLYPKEHSGTGVFLWILRNFKNTFFTGAAAAGSAEAVTGGVL